MKRAYKIIRPGKEYRPRPSLDHDDTNSAVGEKQQNKELLWRPWVENLENRMPKNEKVAPHSCPYPTCKTHPGFKRKPELMRHFHTQHMDNREECEYCGKGFTRKDNLTRHVKSSHEKEKPECKFCRKPLSRKDAVNRHQASCPENPEKPKFIIVVDEEEEREPKIKKDRKFE